MAMRLVRACCLAALTTLGACRSGEDVWREMQPAVAERVEQIAAVVGELPDPGAASDMDWPALPVKVCSLGTCGYRGAAPAWLTTEAALAGRSESPLGQVQAGEWWSLPNELLRGSDDLQGRPLHERHGPALSDALQSFLSLEHVLVLSSRLRIDPWLPLGPDSLDVLAPPDAEGSTAEHAHRVNVDAQLWGVLWWYDVDEARFRGGITFAVDHEVADREYTLAESHQLVELMRRSAWEQVRAQLRAGLSEELVPAAL